jgi:hypothetical protein
MPKIRLLLQVVIAVVSCTHNVHGMQESKNILITCKDNEQVELSAEWIKELPRLANFDDTLKAEFATIDVDTVHNITGYFRPKCEEAQQSFVHVRNLDDTFKHDMSKMASLAYILGAGQHSRELSRLYCVQQSLMGSYKFWIPFQERCITSMNKYDFDVCATASGCLFKKHGTQIRALQEFKPMEFIANLLNELDNMMQERKNFETHNAALKQNVRDYLGRYQYCSLAIDRSGHVAASTKYRLDLYSNNNSHVRSIEFGQLHDIFHMDFMEGFLYALTQNTTSSAILFRVPDPSYLKPDNFPLYMVQELPSLPRKAYNQGGVNVEQSVDTVGKRIAAAMPFFIDDAGLLSFNAVLEKPAVRVGSKEPDHHPITFTLYKDDSIFKDDSISKGILIENPIFCAEALCSTAEEKKHIGYWAEWVKEVVPFCIQGCLDSKEKYNNVMQQCEGKESLTLQRYLVIAHFLERFSGPHWFARQVKTVMYTALCKKNLKEYGKLDNGTIITGNALGEITAKYLSENKNLNTITPVNFAELDEMLACSFTARSTDAIERYLKGRFTPVMLSAKSNSILYTMPLLEEGIKRYTTWMYSIEISKMGMDRSLEGMYQDKLRSVSNVIAFGKRYKGFTKEGSWTSVDLLCDAQKCDTATAAIPPQELIVSGSAPLGLDLGPMPRERIEEIIYYLQDGTRHLLIKPNNALDYLFPPRIYLPIKEKDGKKFVDVCYQRLWFHFQLLNPLVWYKALMALFGR